MKKAKKIHISHIPNTFNYGSAMMAIALIHQLNDLLKGEVEFYTDASTPEDLDRLRASTGLANIHVLPPAERGFTRPPEWKTMPRWRKYFYIPAMLRGWKRKQTHLIKSYDAVIVLGGDDLSEYYSKRSLFFELVRLKYISRKIPLILSGQTLGPFTSYRKKWASYCLKKALIFTRDDVAKEHCVKDLGLMNTVSSRDLAFLKLPFQDDVNKRDWLLSKYGLTQGEYIAVVCSGLTAQYTSRRQDFINNFSEILKIAVEKNYGGKIAFLAHVLRPDTSDDRPVMEDIVARLRERNLENVIDRLVIINDELLPYEARLILGNGQWTITCRMHAAISTFQMNRPAISLSYSMKYEGVLAKGMGLPELVIEARGDDRWKDLNMAREVEERINLIKSRCNEINERVKSGSIRCRDLTIEQIEKIASVMVEIK